MTEYNVRVEFKTRAARAWVRVMAFAAPLIGSGPAWRWASAGARRLTRYRVAGSRRWSPLPRPERA